MLHSECSTSNADTQAFKNLKNAHSSSSHFQLEPFPFHAFIHYIRIHPWALYICFVISESHHLQFYDFRYFCWSNKEKKLLISFLLHVPRFRNSIHRNQFSQIHKKSTRDEKFLYFVVSFQLISVVNQWKQLSSDVIFCSALNCHFVDGQYFLFFFWWARDEF